tara:strand:+ start:59 stop:766 length:708 start_codon:yes stop_codon:yes gene_type:complete
MKKKIAFSIVFLSCLVVCAFLIPSAEKQKFNQDEKFNDDIIYGIDVSHHQEKIDWKKVSNHNNPKIEFVYIKATEGVTWKDKRFKYNYRNAKENGLRVGVYHFFSPITNGKKQFKEFKKTYPKNDKDLPVLVDCERMGKSLKKYLKQLNIFLDLCENYYGQKPLIYSTQRFYNTYLKEHLKEYRLMIGRYNNRKYEPNLLDGKNWDIWQFTEKGNINGISEYVDINIAKEKFWLY